MYSTHEYRTRHATTFVVVTSNYNRIAWLYLALVARISCDGDAVLVYNSDEGLDIIHDLQARRLKPLSTPNMLTIDLLGDAADAPFLATSHDGVCASHNIRVRADKMRVM